MSTLYARSKEDMDRPVWLGGAATRGKHWLSGDPFLPIKVTLTALG